MVSCQMKLFADDAKVFSGISTHSEAEALQADLDALVNVV